MIRIRDIHKQFGDLKVLNGINLDIEEGEIVSIVGKSGAGKSTLLHIIGTLDTPSKGRVSINGQEVTRYSQKQLAEFRNKHIGFVFQFHHLLPEFSAVENVAIPGYIGGKSKEESRDKARYLLDYLGLGERLSHRPSEMSGGEQQRVAIARALMNDPDIILADEPTGNLDTATSMEIHQLILDLRATFNRTFVIVTHSRDLATMSDRVITMKDGNLLSSDS